MTLSHGYAGTLGRALFPLAFAAFVTCLRASSGGTATDLNDQVFRYESSGDLANARSFLDRQAQSPGNSAAAQALAEFLERHHDSGYRDAYLRWAREDPDPANRKLALRQLVLLDYMDGRRADLEADLAKYREAGGTDLQLPSAKAHPAPYSTILIPGPLASFARMAALTPDLAPEDLLPALARNVVTNGYQASRNESLEQTEYLKLLIRYIGQARELQAMAGPAHKIVIPSCDSTQTGDLLKILGYRMRGSCGGDLVLETVNPTRAFLSDPSLCRLYLGLSHLDRATAEALRTAASPAKLKIYAHVLDFFGGMFEVRNGAAVVPGSPRVWASMVGVSPNKPGQFFERLIATDDGWMASYFDTLARLRGPAAAYLEEPQNTKRFYEALRGKITSPGPARPVFRASADLMLLTTSLRIGPDGKPLVPGNLDVWRTLFVKHPHGKYDGRLTRSASSWRNNDDLIEALFALCRKSVENEPLKIFLALNDIDRNRAKPMSPQLAARLIAAYRTYGAQYILFADNPTLSEATIEHYLDACSSVSNIRDMLLRTDTLGSLQALTGLFDILSRQGMIPADRQDATFSELIRPFVHIKDAATLFDADRGGVALLLSAAGRSPHAGVQQQLVELLVGDLRPSSPPAPPCPAETLLRVFDQQQLISLDLLFALADGAAKGHVDPGTAKAVREQLSRFEEVADIRASLSSEERSTLAFGYWSERHIEQERKFNLDALVKNQQKKDPRAELVPFLRDSLVGLLYAYYAPEGAQLLLTNPVFVRSHGFIGAEGSPAEWRETALAATGWPESGGGRLTGSLISLPYALAEAEQNFLSPKREQALIWGDLAPQMIASITLTRWRNITPEQIRWVALHLERGRTLLAAASLDPSLRPRVLESFSHFATPERVEWLADRLAEGNFARIEAGIAPAALYQLAEDPALASLSRDVPSVE